MEFADRIAAAGRRLAGITEEQAALPWREGGWLRKEVLGHLLDSAANNHVRFAFAALAGSYEGPIYDQQGWVRLHGYARLPWSELLERWRLGNHVLAGIVAAIPEAALEAPCRLAGRPPVPLRFLIGDYLDHLEHHVGQITGGLA
jgi:hypothetical protein